VCAAWSSGRRRIIIIVFSKGECAKMYKKYICVLEFYRVVQEVLL